MVQVQKTEKVNLLSKFLIVVTAVCLKLVKSMMGSLILDSDKDEGTYCPPVKRERTSSFPPPHSGKLIFTKRRILNMSELHTFFSKVFICCFPVPKNNVFMPSSFCQSPTGNSDSEPGEVPLITETARLFTAFKSRNK